MAQDKICSVISKLLEKTKVVSTEAMLKPNLSTVDGGNAEQLFSLGTVPSVTTDSTLKEQG